ncbi:MAG: hypothetical protein FJW86_11340 [Actinobacteria bacterium]|nr:hypothetical protein [Actinomycetota bacterium]
MIAATGIEEGPGEDSLKAIGYVFVFCAYIALAFVTTYFLGALVHAANEHLNGRQARVGESIGAATGKIHRILPWAVVTATVSVVLQAMEERMGWLGVVIARLLGAAWAAVTFLTVPVIMLEDLGPIDALKRSGRLLKQTWGENLSAQVAFSLLGFVVMIPAFLVAAIGISSDNTGVIIVMVGLAVVWALIVTMVIAAMSGIFRTALYRYAVDGTAPPAFAGAELGEAFGEKRNQGGLFN